jgi:predicted nucleic acid-binding Zn ribbon protein
MDTHVDLTIVGTTILIHAEHVVVDIQQTGASGNVASYEYKCEIDSSTITISRGMTEEEIIPYCDSCNEPMVRVYSAPPVKFNGSGFYSTGG